MFVDSLDPLQAIMRWQEGDFWPCTHRHSHMDILIPLVACPRQHTGITRLVKVKSHLGLWI